MQGHRPWHKAVAHHNLTHYFREQDILLNEGGADPSIANHALYTPKWAACRGGFTDIASALDQAARTQGSNATGHGYASAQAQRDRHNVDDDNGWASSDD